MRLSIAIRTLESRREYLTRRILEVGEHHGHYQSLRQEAKAIDTVLPVLREELERRHVQVMEQRGKGEERS